MKRVGFPTDVIFRRLTTVLAAVTLFCTLSIFFFVVREAIPALQKIDLSSFFSTQWVPVSPLNERFGLLPLIYGSFLVTGIALFVSVPVSLATAIYIAYLAKPAESRLLKAIVELLASIPSVVFGFIGLIALVPLLKDVFHLQSGLTALTGGLILALMAAPTIVTLAEDALRAVPTDFADASTALGASKPATIFRVLVPYAMPGIASAVLLGLGRIMGETMAVLMVTGNSPLLSWSILEPVRTLTATIAAEMGEVVYGSTHYHLLFLLGLLLLLSTFATNYLATVILRGTGYGHRY